MDIGQPEPAALRTAADPLMGRLDCLHQWRPPFPWRNSRSFGSEILSPSDVKFWNSLAGLSFLSIVVLLKLVVIVALFETVRLGLSALDAASRTMAGQPGTTDAIETASGHFVSALALTLVPLFAFCAVWGFLGDTVRDYSRLPLDLFLAGEGTSLLHVSGGAWLVVVVAIALAARRFLKFMPKRSRASVWPLLIIACKANWVFLGLFILSEWQDEIRARFSHLPETIARCSASLRR